MADMTPTGPSDSSGVQKSHLFDNLKGLIQVVDQLRDVGLNNYISLPRIVVVGTQSSGKSSCLENVVGLDFLPRGDGVVTRRPLELRLKTLPPTADGKETAYAIFDQVDKTKKYYDFADVRTQIDKLTDEVAGVKKGIIDDAIVINVFATGCPNLTVIDLPGITRVAMANTDQAEDIEQVTRDMAMRYIKDPLTIILAVIAANQDMSTSDALQLARRADPQGLRTIGVLTKIDIMDPGTDACKMLKGEDIPLRLGYCGLKMRSKADCVAGLNVKDGIKKEADFFNAHARYSKLPDGFVGTPALVSKLSKVFHRHLRRFLPEIKRTIMDRKRETGTQLETLGTGVPEGIAEKQHVMWTLITAFCEMFNNTIRGKYDRKLAAYYNEEDKQASSGGAQIRQIFNDYLIDYDNESITAHMPPDEIEQAIRTHEGDSLPGFPSPDTFEFLILPHLKKIDGPSTEVLNNVSNTLEALAQRIARNIFRRFPKLADEVLMLTTDILNREKDSCNTVVQQIVESQTGYLFTNDNSYLSEHASMEPMYKQAEKKAAEEALKNAEAEKANVPPPPPSQAEKFGQGAASAVNYARTAGSEFGRNVFGANQQAKQERNKQSRYGGPFVEEIRRRLDAYFCLIIRNCRDAVPKAIGYFLVRAIQEKLQFELINSLNNQDTFGKLLGEPEEIVRERTRLRSELKIMEDALQVLNRDPNLVKMAMSGMDDDDFGAPHQPGLGNGHARSAPTAPAPARSAPAPAPSRPAPAPAPAAARPAPTAPGGYSAPRPAPPAPSAPRPAARAGLFDDGPSTGAPKRNANPLFD